MLDTGYWLPQDSALPHGDEACVGVAGAHQLGMSPVGDDPTAVHHDHPIRLFGAAEPVGDDDGGAGGR